MHKNTAGQFWRVYATYRNTRVPFTGGAATITATINKDDAGEVATDDTHPTEVGTSGYYDFALTKDETNAYKLTLKAVSSASGVEVTAIPPIEITVVDTNVAVSTGARTCVLTVNDGATVLESARVRVTKGAESYVLNTNVSGQATFNLDDGSWVVAITLAGYTYSGTTLVVDGDETATYSMTLVTITPSAAGFVTGYWTCYGTNGAIEAGTTHYLQVVEGAGTAGLSIDGTKRTAVSGVDGVVQFAGIPHGASVRVWRGTAKPMGPFVAPTSGTTWAMDEVVGTP